MKPNIGGGYITTSRSARRLCVLALLCSSAVSADPTMGENFVGAANGKVYHTHPDCSAMRKIAEENRVHFPSVEQAELEGRRLCKTCEKLKAKSDIARSAERPNRKKSTSAQSESSASAGSGIRIFAVQPGGTLVLEKGEKATPACICLPQQGQEMAEEAVRFIQERIGDAATSQRLAQSFQRDHHGRLRVLIHGMADAPDLSAALLSAGLAWVDDTQMMLSREEYRSLEQEAWEKGLGIWKRLPGAAGQIEVVVGKYATQYHPIECRHEMHLLEAARITLNEAKARRLTPCEVYRFSSNADPRGSTARRSHRKVPSHEEKK